MSFFFGKVNKTNWFRFVARHPHVVITLVLMVSLCLGWKLPDLKFQTSISDLAVIDLPETTRYQEFKENFGSEALILVVIRAKHVFDPVTFSKIDQLSHALSGISGVKRIVSLPVIKKDMDVTDQWRLDEFEDIIAPIDILRKNLLSDDRTRTVITLILDDLDNREKIIASVERIISKEKNDLSLYQIGMPVVFETLARYTQQDFVVLPPITFLVIGIVLFFLFRNARGILLPIACVHLCLIWTFGLMAWLNISLSMITMIVPIFLIAVGTAYCMYIINGYMRSAQKEEASDAIVVNCFSEISLPITLAVFTTMIGLCSLLINKIQAIREFAIFSCIGMASCLLILFSLLPAFMTVLHRPVSASADKMSKANIFDRFLSTVIQVNLSHQKQSFLILGVVVLLSTWGIFHLRIETNPVEYFKSDSPVSRNFHDIYIDMAGSFPINVVLDSRQADYFEKPENIAKISRIEKFLNSLDGVDKTVSFAEYLKLVNYAKNRNEPPFYSLPTEPFEVRMLINTYKSMLGEDMLRNFINKDFSKANILLRTHISSSRDLLKTKEKIQEHLQNVYSRDFDFDITGIGMLISQTSDILTKSQIKSLSITLALVFLIMLMFFISGKVSLVAIASNCFPIIVNFGLMGWLGIELSMVTCLIASIAIGLAVDDTIHYLTTYSREIKKDLNKNRALHDTVMSVGKPIVFTTLVISLGFSILMFSHFKPTAIFGLMMVVTMFAALVGDLILLPSLMLHVELVTVWDVLKLMKPMRGLSGGLAHELNQPLNAIKMGSEFLKMMLEQKEKIPENQLDDIVNEIDRQVDRASDTIKRLSNFDQKDALIDPKTTVDINVPVRNVIAVLEHQFTLQNINLELDLDDTVYPVSAHQNRLEQVIYNLLSNAKDAVLRKQLVESESFQAVIGIKTLTVKKRAGIIVSDNGVGIPKNMQDRIFEPFFTCDEAGCGLGLGLSITYGIVKSYGGRIHIKSKENMGTTFTLTFPFASSQS